MGKRGGHEERGQATVEFAIVLPLVLLLIAGVIEFGKAFNYWLSLNHIANEGARWAAVSKLPPNGSSPGNADPKKADIKAYLRSQIASDDLRQRLADADRIKICAAQGANAGIGDQATVTVRAEYEFPIVSSLAGFAGDVLGSGDANFGKIELTGTSTVRLEQLPTWADPAPPNNGPDTGC